MSNDKPTRGEIEGLWTEGARAVEDMAELAERLDYRGKQLMLPNRAHLTSITTMMEDNPGLVEAMYDWIADNLADEDRDEEDDECDE